MQEPYALMPPIGVIPSELGDEGMPGGYEK